MEKQHIPAQLKQTQREGKPAEGYNCCSFYIDNEATTTGQGLGSGSAWGKYRSGVDMDFTSGTSLAFGKTVKEENVVTRCLILLCFETRSYYRSSG